MQLSSEWFVVVSAVYECKDSHVQTCSFMCCSYGCEVWSVISSEDVGCQVQMTGPEREFVTEGQNVTNDELHIVCHLSCIGSLKNSFKAYASFILRRTIMKFVVKCSEIQNFLFFCFVWQYACMWQQNCHPNSFKFTEFNSIVTI